MPPSTLKICPVIQLASSEERNDTGNEEKKYIREWVDKAFLARDSRAFREHIKNSQPDVDLSYILDNGKEVVVPIGLNFFWPDA